MKIKDCSVLYKVDYCVPPDLKVFAYDASMCHFVNKVTF